MSETRRDFHSRPLTDMPLALMNVRLSFERWGNRPALKILGAALQIESVGQFSPAEIAGL
jgi:hypothetical protein